MKLPRGISGGRLIRVLERLGSTMVRQKGSHVRMRHAGPPVHSITIPLHAALKTGTLHDILTDVAHMRSIPVESLAESL